MNLSELIEVLTLISKGKYVPIHCYTLATSSGSFHYDYGGTGLCKVIDYYIHLDTDTLLGFYRSWSGYSGIGHYPVPSTSKKRRPGIEYAACTDKTPDAFYKGRYGNLRRDLAGHLANEFRALTQTLQSDSFEGRAGKSAVCTGTAHPV